MKYQLTLKFDKARTAKEVIEAKDRADLDKVIKNKPFWYRNRDRATVELISDRKMMFGLSDDLKTKLFMAYLSSPQDNEWCPVRIVK